MEAPVPGPSVITDPISDQLHEPTPCTSDGFKGKRDTTAGWSVRRPVPLWSVSEEKPLRRRSISMSFLAFEASDILTPKGLVERTTSLLHLSYKKASLPVPLAGASDSSTSQCSLGGTSPATGLTPTHEDHDCPFSGEVDRQKPQLVHNWSSSAQTHQFKQCFGLTFETCITCNRGVFMQAFHCSQCKVYSHSKCLKYMVIICGKREKKRLFGVPLMECHEPVPPVLRDCIREIEARGSTLRGIYDSEKVNSKRAKRIVRSYENASEAAVDLGDTPVIDIVIVVKEYFIALPEPLMTHEMYKRFMELASKYTFSLLNPIDYHNTIEAELKEAVEKLPPNHCTTLAFIVHHLKKISRNSKHNDMTTQKLSDIFAPLLFQNRIPRRLVQIMGVSAEAVVVNMLITHADNVFGPLYK